MFLLPPFVGLLGVRLSLCVLLAFRDGEIAYCLFYETQQQFFVLKDICHSLKTQGRNE